MAQKQALELSIIQRALKKHGAKAVHKKIKSLEKKHPGISKQVKYLWEACARPSQIAPLGDWFSWVIHTGRGWGKTRTGAEWIRSRVESGKFNRIALIGETVADVRNVMIGDRTEPLPPGENGSGLLDICPPWNRPKYEPSKRRLTWKNANYPSYGAACTTYSGEEPGQLRGPSHDTAWVDEHCKFKYPAEARSNLEFGLRVGPDPKIIYTTTPKNIKDFKELLKDPLTVTTKGHTRENFSNLTPKFKQIISKYEGTRKGREELGGELLEDREGALWNRDDIENNRRSIRPETLIRVAEGVDPPGGSAECGIVLGALGDDGEYYVFDDRSTAGSPDIWGSAAVTGYHLHMTDVMVAETNFGGDMVEHVIKTVDEGKKVNFKKVTASRGKAIRAEPISALYEQGKVHHVGSFPELEDQMCQWVPGEKSPDRLDALVWMLTELSQGSTKEEILVAAPMLGVGD